MNQFRCELLSSKWLSNERILAELSYWLNVMRRPQGWHYDMDEVWALENLSSLPPGSTILDAGAGFGILQYILASRGYNVISLDFGKRTVPVESLGIFNVALENQDEFEYQHPYQEHILFTNSGKSSRQLLSKLFSKRLFYKVRRELNYRYLNHQERSRHHAHYGKITFVRAAFHDIPYLDHFFDAVVSISAIEHADKKMLKQNISEFLRVAKPGAPILITTSATNEKADVFHEPTQGWCFSSETFKTFAPAAVEAYQQYSNAEKSILESTLWRSRLDPYYHLDPKSGFYKRRVNALPYLPIALSRE